jgi:hypothetical protein
MLSKLAHAAERAASSPREFLICSRKTMQVAPKYRSSQQRSGKAKVVSSEETAEARKKRDEKEAAETGRSTRAGTLRRNFGEAKSHVRRKLSRPILKFKHWE